MSLHFKVPVAAAALAVALLAGCTSELPSEVGADLATVALDSVLVPLDVFAVDRYSALAVQDPDLPLSRQQVLYLGGQMGNRSSILVNFDFDAYASEDFPESLFTAGNIQTVKLSLTRLRFYGEAADTNTPVVRVFYRIYALDAPFDSTAFPGPVPPHDGRDLNADYFLEQGSLPQIPLYKSDFLEWIAEGGVRGFLIQAGAESDSGLVGFAARDLRRFSEIPPVAVGTVPAPNLVVNFASEEINRLIPPQADISTFDRVPAPPAVPDATLLVRTCLRQYPALLFSLAKLPPDVYINRAVLVLHNDTSRSFGTLQTLVVSELDTGSFGDPYGSLTLERLGQLLYPVTGTFNNDPDFNRRFDFNVTTSLQRAVNGAYTGVRGFVLTADEDFLTGYDTAVIDPDFYFNEFHFHGTAAPDSVRPHLLIHYSSVTGLGGDGDE